MNYIKLQQDIIKAVSSDRTKNDYRFVDGAYDGRIYVVYKGIAIYSVPEPAWFLDTPRIIEKTSCSLPLMEDFMNSFKKHLDSAVHADFTGIVIAAGKQLNVYEAKLPTKTVKTYADPVLFKIFADKYAAYEYRIIDERMPIYVVDEYGEMVGAVLGVKI